MYIDKKISFKKFWPSHLFIYLVTCLLTFGVNFLNNFQKKIHRFLKYKIQIRDSISIFMILEKEKVLT